MDFRFINASSLNEAGDLWGYCFEKRGTPFFEWYFGSYCLKQNSIIGGYDDAALACMLHLNPYEIVLRGQVVKLPYIVGVAVAPEYRGRHLLADLLGTTFTILRAQGAAFAFLLPINPQIYLPYGFATCYYRHLYRVPLARLKLRAAAHEPRLERRLPSAEQATELAPVYEHCLANYNGYALRSKAKWQELLNGYCDEGAMLVVALDGKAVHGYMLYTIEDKAFKVQELMAADAPTMLAFLRFAMGHEALCAEFEWSAPSDDLLYLWLEGATPACALQPAVMARCINIRKALQQLPVPAGLSGRATILVTDDEIPLNSGLLKLRAQDGVLDVKQTADAEDVAMDIAAFTQLCFGAFSVHELAAAGRLRIGNAEAARFLNELFAKCNNYINELY